MEITEIRIAACESRDSRLRAFCSVVFDNAFIVRELRIIQKGNQLFVAMPSRRSVITCHRCSGKNNVGSLYCNHCGLEFQSQESKATKELVFTDIAHPITQDFRDQLEAQVINAYLKRKSQAG